MTFEQWWEDEGRFIDPDPKTEALARAAYAAGLAAPCAHQVARKYSESAMSDWLSAPDDPSEDEA